MTNEDYIEPTIAEWSLKNYLILIMGVQWVLGIIFIEYFYYKTRKLRKLEPKAKERLMEIRNEPEKWNRIVFYLSKTLI